MYMTMVPYQKKSSNTKIFKKPTNNNVVVDTHNTVVVDKNITYPATAPQFNNHHENVIYVIFDIRVNLD